MYSVWGWLLILAVFIWLGVLNYLLWKEKKFLNLLFPKSGQRDIRRKFEEVIEQTTSFKKDIYKLEGKVLELEGLGLKHVQRVHFSRYNPYDETGGDQSFSLALLDGKGNGIVITSLHARSSTRVFAKPVILGKSSNFRFSQEEADVVKKTMEK